MANPLLYVACTQHMIGRDQWILDLLEPIQWAQLESFADYSTYTGHSIPHIGKSFFLDSGAYSVATRKLPLTITDYRDFLLRYQGQYDYCANLDVIPTWGIEKGLEWTAEKTFENQIFLEKAGLKPIPVFHKGEPWEYLQMYAEDYEYICLGNLTKNDPGLENYDFFPQAWGQYLTNPDGTPKLKVHAFGMTALDPLRDYPWFSADSSSWLVWSRIGYIVVPQSTRGKYDYNKRYVPVAVSNKSGERAVHGWHWDTMDAGQREYVSTFVKTLGINVEQCFDDNAARNYVNLMYYIDFSHKATFTDRYVPRQAVLLDG